MRLKIYSQNPVRVSKTFCSVFLLVAGFLFFNFDASAQCNNAGSFGTGAAPAPGATTQLTTCAFGGEFSTITAVAAATPYRLNATGGTGNFVTIRQGTSGGPVIAFGPAPLLWTSTVAGSYFAHINPTAACGNESQCHTLTVTNMTGPTVTINQAAGQADPTSVSPINFTVVFSQAVTGFTTGDITLGGTAGATTATVTGSGTTYNVAVTGMTLDGTVVPSIAAGVAVNGVGANNDASTSTDNTVTYVVPTCFITCPSNITQTADANQCGAVVNYPAPTSTGTCGGPIVASPASGSFFPKGVTTVTVTSPSGGGFCQFTVTVTDNQLPTITCPGNVVVNNTAGQCGAVVNYAAITASDNCPGTTITRIAGPASGSLFPVGVTTTVTHRATDAAGNFVDCSFTVKVNDTQAPTITCPANIVVSNTANQCGANVTFAPITTDNCPIGSSTPVSINQSSSNTITPGSVSCNLAGSHADNSYWRAYDLAPLNLVGPFTINTVRFGVEQALAGVGTSQPVNVRIYTQTGAAFPGGTRTLVRSEAFSIPNQSGTIFSANLVAPVTVPANSVVILELNTPNGQASGHRFFIGSNAAAETAPGFISAADCAINTPTSIATVGFPLMHIILAADGSVPVPGSGSVSVPASGSFFPVGTTTVTSTATDGSGNTATCSFTVKVNDTQAPAITCPAPVTVTTPVGSCVAVVNYAVTATDNCPGTTTARTAGLASGSSFPLGVNTVTYTATDAAGNISTCSFTITVLDGQLPVISAQPVNRTGCAGSNQTFSVTSSNATSYQWQQFIAGVWTNVAGATGSSLTLNGITQAMNDNAYRVNVIGLCTTVTSGFATLTVNPLPTVSITTTNSPVLTPLQTTSIIATVSPTGGTFAWFKNGAPRVPTVTTGVLSNLGVDDAGTYRYVYTDLNGCVATSGDIVITAEASDRFYVAPNPNYGQFWVRFYNQAGENVTLTVFDSKGSRVFQRSVVTALPYTRIDIDLGTNAINAPGVYLVEMRGSDGEKLGSKQIIVGHR